MTQTTLDYPGLLRLLAKMYLDLPAPAAIAAWQSVLTGEVPAALLPLRESVKAISIENRAEIQELETEFTRLFVGPAALPCPPWESMYTSPNRQMMQKAFDDMEDLYAEAGVRIRASEILPDHIGAELNFLALLLDGFLNGNEQDALMLADRLLDEHLNNWVAPFTADVERAARSGLYKALARATRNVLSLLQE